VYSLPKFSGGNIVAREVLNGWGLNGIFQIISSSPIWVTQSLDGENNGNANERPDLVAGQPLTLPKTLRTINEWFNTAAFTEAVAHYGSTPRNPAGVTGPTVTPLTLAIKRSFVLPYKQQHVDLRLEVFNALNHPQFGSPGGTQGTSSFGVISSTKIDNRELQLAVKYFF
jgi:hypothetical protein